MKRIVTEKYAQAEMVDMNAKPNPMPSKLKNTLQNEVHRILKPTYFEQIPLKDIFDVFAANGVMAVQEDGTKWSGMLVGGKGCGEDGAESQRADIELAIKNGPWWKITTSALSITWCKMPSGKMEVIGYIS